MINFNDDIILANNVRRRAKVKYSNHPVGAVLMTKSGKKYTGCNVENHGLQSICAERTAFVKAISEGETDFERIVIIGGKKDEKPVKCLPCGYCRQFMSEYVGKDFKIYTIYDDKAEEYTMEELLPYGFEF